MSEEIQSQPSESTETVTTEATADVVVEGTDQTVSYANGKYNTVSDLESGYAELQKSYSSKLGGFDGAPEEYALGEGVESSSRIEALQAWGKENQLNNDALNSIIAMDSEAQDAANTAYTAEQKEVLGKDADARIQNVVDWGRANLGEDALSTLGDMITSAKGVEVFEAIAKMSQGTAAAQVSQPKAMMDRDTIKAMRFANDQFGQRRMSSDPQYRAKVEAAEAEFLTSGGNL